jgi:hypothetical protein
MRNRNVPGLVLAAILTVAPALVASAQDAPVRKGQKTPTADDQAGGTLVGVGQLPPLGQRAPDFLLLSRPTVQEELKLTDEQKKKIAQAERLRRERSTEVQKRVNEAKQNPFSPVPVDDLVQIQEAQQQLNQEDGTAIEKLLTPKQRARLTQIGLQLDGPMAFAREDVLQKLNVDDGQAEAIREILEEARGEMNKNGQFRVDTAPSTKGANPGAVNPIDRNIAKFQENVAQSRKVVNDGVKDATMQKIARLLRKKQLDAFNRLKGEPFDPDAPKGAAAAGTGKPEATAAQPKDATDPETTGQTKSDTKPVDRSKSPSRKSLRDRRGTKADGK